MAEDKPLVQNQEAETKTELEFADRNKAAEAAQRRLEKAQASTGVSVEKAEELKLKREKDELLGKIQHYYASAGKEPPFGLAVAPVGTLRTHLEYAKNLKSSS